MTPLRAPIKLVLASACIASSIAAGSVAHAQPVVNADVVNTPNVIVANAAPLAVTLGAGAVMQTMSAFTRSCSGRRRGTRAVRPLMSQEVV